MSPRGFGPAGRRFAADATIHPTSGLPYSSCPYCRKVKLRLLSVQIRVFAGPFRYIFSCLERGKAAGDEPI